MEILIVGSLLVALMVWASTRIKRTAAAAWDEETIVGEGFVIKKPDGFLNVINGDAQYAFEAYSKEFGGPGAEDTRAASATVQIFDAGDYEIVTDSRTEVIGDRRYQITETESIEKGIAMHNISKSAAQEGKVYVLAVRRPSETSAELMRKIQSMIDSFELN